MPWPLEPVKTHEFAEGLDEILVVEEKRSVIEDQLTGQLYNWPVDERPRVIGEYDEQGEELLTNLSELTPAMIARVIAKRIQRFYTNTSIDQRVDFINQKERSLAEPRLLSERKATYCSGCPHNSSTVVPEGSIAAGGIGCHYMGTWSKTRPVHNYTQMGGEGTTWVGIAPFTETPHIFQNLGDGTYFHSGILAIRQAVSAKVNITYKILYNDAVAMTGGQKIDGSLTIPELILQLKGEGIRRIELVSDDPSPHAHLADNVVAVSDRKDLDSVQKSLREEQGCTVLIYQQLCATEKRRRRKRGELAQATSRVLINDAVCEGCGDCSLKSNCLSVIPKETEFGRKREIDQAACNTDRSCVNGFCPSFVTVSGPLKKPSAVSADSLPPIAEPVQPSLEQPWNVLVTGVGGTGVLTVAAVLSMAAHLESKGVATMNQTGLAQKFGPVVSHLRIAKHQAEIHAVRIPAGDADLVLGADLLVTAGDDALAKMHKNRSHVIVNDTVSATSEFIDDPDTVFHVDAMKQSILGELSEGHATFFPASEIAQALLGDPIATNLLLVGYAYQKGLLPVSAEAINRALELNGVKVEFNQQAFYWGRRVFIDQQQVEDSVGLAEQRFKPKSSLAEIVDYRRDDLVAYQDNEYAARYVDRIAEVERVEETLCASQNLTIAVAKALHKLMAIKDEYEVARLYTDGRFEKQLKEKFEGDVKLQFHMAPPLLSRRDPNTGEARKIKLGGYMMPMFRLMARLKGLRGTPLDVFGYSSERRMERRLIDEFNQTLDILLTQLTPENHGHAIEIVNLVLKVRGYGHVKERNYQQYQQELANQLSLYSQPPAPINRIKVEVAKVA